MARFHFIPVIAIALVLSLGTSLHGQNPPMNCAPDGIVEVCTLADTTPAQSLAAPVVPPPPAAPHVTYKNGQLTITAENVPLSDVLREVSRKTGAALEVPNGSATEPVFANIGPGSVREVLVKLLNGTKFNYVMLGSKETSSDLEKIVLTSSDGSNEVAQGSVPDISLPRQPQQKASAAGADESEEQKKNDFMSAVASARDARMQQLQEKYSQMASEGNLRTPDPPNADSRASGSPAPDPPVSDPSSQ
jgi:hypothetical protein